jgi:hypothetical protein
MFFISYILMEKKPQKYHRTIEDKIKIVELMSSYSMHALSENYQVDRKTLREWKSNYHLMLLQGDQKRKSIKSLTNITRRSVTYELEDMILAWIDYQRDDGILVSREMVIHYACFLCARLREKSITSQKELVLQIHEKK